MRLVETYEQAYNKHLGERACKKRTVVCAGSTYGKFTSIAHNYHVRSCDCFIHSPNPSPNAIHAEVRPILMGCDTLYITYQPCTACVHKMIEQGTVKAVYYRDQDSKASTESIELMESAGIYVSNQWLSSHSI